MHLFIATEKKTDDDTSTAAWRVAPQIAKRVFDEEGRLRRLANVIAVFRRKWQQYKSAQRAIAKGHLIKGRRVVTTRRGTFSSAGPPFYGRRGKKGPLKPRVSIHSVITCLTTEIALGAQ